MGWRLSVDTRLLAAAWVLTALPAPLVAGDFQVNTYTTGKQSVPKVAASGDGSFVLAWSSDDSYGSDTSSTSVQARRYAPDGVPLGPEFQVNSFTPNFQFPWGIATTPDGRFIVAWTSLVLPDELEVRAQRYASDGNPAGVEIHVNTYTTGDQGLPSVAMDPSGAFIVAWQGLPSLDVHARRFAADGTPASAEFQVNTYTTMEQRYPSVAFQPWGSFIVTWTSDGSFGNDTFLTSVQTRLYAPDGTPVGAEFQVNTYTVGDQAGSQVGVDPLGGNFVVVWSSTRFTSEFDVAARRYSPAGVPLTDEFLINTYTTGQQSGGRIGVAPGGEFLVAWTSKPIDFAPPTDCSACDIMARRFRSDGTAYAPEFLVNSYSTTGWQAVRGLAVDGAGNFIVAWESEGSPDNDDDNYSIQATREVSELQIANDDGVTTTVPGGSLTYTITASYITGLQAVVNATVTDIFSATLSCTWTCVGTAGGVCTPGPVSGSISDPVVLPVGSSVTYTANCVISSAATGSIVNTATVAGGPGLFDPVPANNAVTDVDVLEGLVIDDVSQLEGNSGTTGFGFTVTLASPLASPVTVDFGTQDGTATVAGGDYLAVSGTLTFAPGETSKPVVVSVVGDTVFETDETFQVALSNPVGSFLVDGAGLGTILNDDSALPSGSMDELVHGSVETRSLASLPGPVAIAQVWRLRQAPNASYEIVVDAVTGDLGPDGPALDRLASDGSVVQSAVADTGGSSRSLRFENRGGAVIGERIRVQSRGCVTDCDAGDTFRIRLYETTLQGARFNNSATQVTVAVLQNASELGVGGHMDFWSAGGALLHSEPFALSPKGTVALNTSTLGPLQGQGGSMTISHDGHFGALMGKAVAVEPATGFTFDTALEPRRR